MAATTLRRLPFLMHLLKAAGLQTKVCQRVAEESLRIRGVRFRRPRERIYITEEDAKIRKKTCEVWSKKPKFFWDGSSDKSVKAYMDNKAWPMPLHPTVRHFCPPARQPARAERPPAPSAPVRTKRSGRKGLEPMGHLDQPKPWPDGATVIPLGGRPGQLQNPFRDSKNDVRESQSTCKN